ncbi:MAPK-interacting and spindle-stabilizing protein-like [Diachasmimorpha longicaudata]|uniref:MAPK-interacting and spindle-stabilizing protein-like n=1 Tax=Diachasmimorpha longicaudata TaxID=58733 RepID=UPI0030B89228
MSPWLHRSDPSVWEEWLSFTIPTHIHAIRNTRGPQPSKSSDAGNARASQREMKRIHLCQGLPYPSPPFPPPHSEPPTIRLSFFYTPSRSASGLPPSLPLPLPPPSILPPRSPHPLPHCHSTPLMPTNTAQSFSDSFPWGNLDVCDYFWRVGGRELWICNGGCGVWGDKSLGDWGVGGELMTGMEFREEF